MSGSPISSRLMRPEPAFQAPWHAQLFALTVQLNEAGLFEWDAWSKRFGATLARHGHARSLNGGDDYFGAWLETLEHILSETGVASAEVLRRLQDAWAEAYLTTPHGQPVQLRR